VLRRSGLTRVKKNENNTFIAYNYYKNIQPRAVLFLYNASQCGHVLVDPLSEHVLLKWDVASRLTPEVATLL